MNGFCGILENINDGINQNQVDQWLTAAEIQLYSSCIKNTDDAFVVASDVGGDGEIVEEFNILKEQIKNFNLYKIAKSVVINYMLVLALKQTEFELILLPPNKLELTEEYHTNIVDNLSQLSSLILFQGPPNTKLPQNDVIIVINLLNSLFEVSVKIIELVNNRFDANVSGNDCTDGVLKMTIELLSASGSEATSGSRGHRRHKTSNKKKKKQSGGAIEDVDVINVEEIMKDRHKQMVVIPLVVDDIIITIPKAKKSPVWTGKFHNAHTALTVGIPYIKINIQHKSTSANKQPIVKSIKDILNYDFSKLCEKLNLLPAGDTSITECMKVCIGRTQNITLNNLNAHIDEFKKQFKLKCNDIFEKNITFGGSVPMTEPLKKQFEGIIITFLLPYIKFMEYFRHIYITITTELNKFIEYETTNRRKKLNNCKRYLDHLLLNFSNIFIQTYLIDIKGDSIEYYEEAEQDEPKGSQSWASWSRGTLVTAATVATVAATSAAALATWRRSSAVQGRKKSKKKKGTNSGASKIKSKTKPKAKPKPVTKKKKK